MKKEEAIKKAIKLHSDVPEEVIRRIAGIVCMYGHKKTTNLASDLYDAIIYNDGKLIEKLEI